MNGGTFSIKAPKECSKKFAATFKGKFLTRETVLRIFFCSWRRGSAMGVTVEKASEKGSQKGLRPFARAP